MVAIGLQGCARTRDELIELVVATFLNGPDTLGLAKPAVGAAGKYPVKPDFSNGSK
jgi:hypothetical protein